jgi:hypothetical protein
LAAPIQKPKMHLLEGKTPRQGSLIGLARIKLNYQLLVDYRFQLLAYGKRDYLRCLASRID